jgi:hypothetical protein
MWEKREWVTLWAGCNYGRECGRRESGSLSGQDVTTGEIVEGERVGHSGQDAITRETVGLESGSLSGQDAITRETVGGESGSLSGQHLTSHE